MIPHSRPTIGEDDVAAVGRVLASGHLAQGREVAAFESEVAAALGRAGGVAVGSGTAALHLALRVLGVGPGHEVLIPSYTCAALLHAVELTGARPRFVDCETGGVNLAPDGAGRLISPATAAVIVPHMFGTVAPVEAFRRLGVPIVENCAQALGASRDGRPAGSMGDVTVLSFYATKMITTGEGGMLLADAPALLDEARDLRDYDKKPDHRLRYNYKMTDMAAALGRSQLRRLGRWVAHRRDLAGRYHRALEGIVPSYTPPREGDACYRYVLAAPDAARFVAAMAARGVECARPVHRPLHEHTHGEDCPRASYVHRRAVSIPLYPALSDAEAAEISSLVAECVGTPSMEAEIHV